MKKIILTALVIMTSMAAGFTYMPNRVATSHSGIHTNGTSTNANKLSKGRIVVIEPHRGTLFTVYDQVNISWRFAMGHIAQKCVSIKLYKRNKSIKNLIQRVCRQNFRWKVQNSIADGNYRFKITTIDGKISSYSQIFSIGRADLKVDKNAITIKPEHPDMADYVTLNIPIRNMGLAKAANSKAELNIQGPDGQNYKDILANVGSIAPRGKYIIKEKLSLSKEQYGQYRVKIKLNFNHNISNYSFYANPLPNLAVCIDTGKRPRYGKNTTIRAYVFNKGYKSSKPCNLLIEVDKDYGGSKTYNFYTPSIDKGGLYTATHLKYKWHPFLGLVGDKHSIYAIIDSKHAIKEINERDNNARGFYYPTRHGGKHGAKNKVNCSWIKNYNSVDKSAVGIR